MPRPRLWILFFLIALCVLFRLAPITANFALLGGLGVFLGATIPNLWLGIGLAIGTRLVMDAMLAFQMSKSGLLLYGSLPVILFATALYVVCGRGVRLLARSVRDVGTARRTASVAAFGVGGGVVGSVQFFLLSNLAVWPVMYPQTLSGLLTCYEAAIPFYRMTFASDVIASGVMLGGFCLATALMPATKRELIAAES